MGEDEVNYWCVLLRTSDLQHCAQSFFYFAYFTEAPCSCRFLWTEVFGEFEKLAQRSFPNSSAQNMLP